MKRNKIIIYWLTLLVSVLGLFGGNFLFATQNTTEQDIEKGYKAKVIGINDSKEEVFDYGDGNQIINKTIFFDAILKSGPDKGKTVPCVQYIDGNYIAAVKEVSVGNKIILMDNLNEMNGQPIYALAEYDRTLTLGLLVLAFFVLLILFGQKKGINTLISLVFTVCSIFLVYIPAILKGANIYFITCVICFFIICMSLILIDGASRKTFIAIIGNIGGVVIAGLLALLMNKALFLSGMVDENSMYLMIYNADNIIDLRAIVWSGIVIGSLGAIMDVAMTIASALFEVADNMEHKSFAVLVKSGFNIGRDAIGTMTNTLILAYMGGSLAMVLLLTAYNKNLLYLMNTEMIVVEVIQAILGSIGILFAVPITTLVGAYVFSYNKNKKSNFVIWKSK